MAGEAFAIITVDDLPAVRAFYELLGFALTFQFPSDGEPVFVTMERNGSTLGIGAGSAMSTDRFAYWVYVDDVDGALERVRATGAPVVEAPTERPWGERVAQTRDPDGNLVYLGSPL